ncbi:pectinesterase family protein [Ahniella affigens]|uniref:pectinesterase family protein n=1 Tax=Ahniella affigens TaxID=2021234 RepID=UPI001474B705|nr:pectinesterase family protein [Ahniella affigens]
MVSRKPDDAAFGPLFVDLASALAAAPRGGQRYFIYLAPGIWREKILIERPNVTLVGAGQDQTSVVVGDSAGSLDANGQALGTAASASVTIAAPGFAAQHLTIANDFDYVGARRQLAADPRGPNGLQAVALRLTDAAANARLQAVTLCGHQDTLWVEGGGHRFDSCRIEGSVDFVFGGGTALLNGCQIHSRYRPDAGAAQGCVTAPSTPRSAPLGLVFRNCRLTADRKIQDGSVHLARAWRPTRDFTDGRYGDPEAVGMAAFLNCWMGRHVHPDAFTEMSYQAIDGSRAWLTPNEARFVLDGVRGPARFSALAQRPLQAELRSHIDLLWPDT